MINTTNTPLFETLRDIGQLMLSNKTFNDTLDYVVDWNTGFFTKHQVNHFHPQVLVFSSADKDGEREMVAIPIDVADPNMKWETAGDRARSAFKCGQLLASEMPDFKLMMVFFISEAWMLKVDDPKDINKIPSKSKDRIEVIITVGATIDSRGNCCYQPIDRVGNNRIHLANEENMIIHYGTDAAESIEGEIAFMVVRGFYDGINKVPDMTEMMTP